MPVIPLFRRLRQEDLEFGLCGEILSQQKQMSQKSKQNDHRKKISSIYSLMIHLVF
jgi:hypothetical protein